uniref:Uncharacterized protein n=1 Tax=Chromera velia CCMP2878 TaxID=1169474 RepID=A0A0G4FF09_9ALVE|eukprot:Cvel_16658.t1-p1 / transcript=Cvel_16658.t1 / gene=Cvel_16658 / organism=Chromera_velia_CCMP2878 / gene_product=hypothetical protein / transcript_product=hypothetical protein / location=Cvel_scaffold1292:21487-22478(+) / protein_length=131 / sequence_SO=supercontig / SO=protein_coding / is_pseudo=false
MKVLAGVSAVAVALCGSVSDAFRVVPLLAVRRGVVVGRPVEVPETALMAAGDGSVKFNFLKEHGQDDTLTTTQKFDSFGNPIEGGSAASSKAEPEKPQAPAKEVKFNFLKEHGQDETLTTTQKFDAFGNPI